MWHPIVICDACGHRHQCARLVAEPCSFTLVCHRCEAVLGVRLTPTDLDAQRDLEEHAPKRGLRVQAIALPHRSM